MKSLLAILLIGIFALTACTPGGKKHRSAPTEKKGGGGVDVGNMNGDTDNPVPLKVVMVPDTEVELSYPISWKTSNSGKTLVISNGRGSTIQAEKQDFNLVSPTKESLKMYLQRQNPGVEFKDYKSDGLSGVIASSSTDSNAKSQVVYLLSPLRSIVKLSAHLKPNDSGISEGEEIVTTARVKYLGRAYRNEPVRTVTLENYWLHSDSYKRSDYSLFGDCFPRLERGGCEGVYMNFRTKRKKDILEIGWINGRIIDLGPDAEVPFRNIKIDGEFLVSSMGKTPISDIYTTFRRNDPQLMKDEAEVRVGHVYLARSRQWPDEDIVVKIRVDAHIPGQSVRFSYQKLTFVEKEALKRQVDALNEYTLKYEQPHATGEVVLYNRSQWDDYYNSSFNFEYSTSGNGYITRNSWNLGYSSPFLYPVNSASGFGDIKDAGHVPLISITEESFPDINTIEKGNGRLEAEEGHTYLITHLNFDGVKILGAVKVLKINKDEGWIRLNFKRVHVGPLEEFQDWNLLETSSDLKTIEYEVSSESSSFNWKVFEDSADMISEPYFYTMTGNDWTMSLDPRPYLDWNGMSRLDTAISLDEVTEASFSNNSLKFENHLSGFQVGEVILVRVMGIYEKYLVAIKIIEATETKLKFQTKYLFHGKAPFKQH